MPLDESSEKKPNRKCRQPSEHSSSSSSSSSDSFFSQDASYTSMPPPPDGGYGWMIVFAAFMINFISDGISFSFGILYIELLDYFGESKSLTSWVGSLFYGVCLMGGPLASALATKFGCRQVLIGGALVSCFGTFISAYATDVRMLIVSFGVVTGFGMSMGYMTSIVMVSFYFEHRRSLATGLSVCGSGIGTFVFAPMTELLINTYGWRGTMIIWSGIILNLVVCGALLRPLEFTPRERKARALQKFERMSRTISYSSFTNTGKNSSRHDSHIDSSDDGGENLEMLELCYSQIEIPTYLAGKDIPISVLKGKKTLSEYIQNIRDEEVFEGEEPSQPLTFNNQKHNSIVVMDQNGQSKPKVSCLKKSPVNDVETVPSTSNTQPAKPKKQVRMSSSTYLPLYRKGLFFRRNLNRRQGPNVDVRSTSCPELSRRRWDSVSSDSSEDDDGWECIWRYFNFSKHMKRVIKMLIDPAILKNPLYVMFAFSNFILYFWYDVPYIFMADRATELGIEESKRSLLISVLGIVNTFGQIIYGVVGDLEVNLDLLYGVSLMACGLSVLIVPLFTNFYILATLSGLFGLFISVNYSLCTVMLVEYLGLDKLANAYGLMMLVQGIANLVGPPFAALLYDFTHSYDMTFYCGGLFIMIAGVMLLFMPFVNRCLKRKKRRDNRDVPFVAQLSRVANQNVVMINEGAGLREEAELLMNNEVGLRKEEELVMNNGVGHREEVRHMMNNGAGHSREGVEHRKEVEHVMNNGMEHRKEEGHMMSNGFEHRKSGQTKSNENDGLMNERAGLMSKEAGLMVINGVEHRKEAGLREEGTDTVANDIIAPDAALIVKSNETVL